jgi:Na+/melibiose symporter-like transporter
MIIIFIILQIRRGDRATIPLRVFSQKTVLFGSLYSCFLNMALYTHIFYLPFYFQAVKGTTAVESGIRTIPYLLSVILASVIVAGTITAIGFYKPFMIIGAAIFTVGAGMVYTLSIDSGAGMWIGYQILAGFGAGGGVQVPFIAIQVVLDQKDMPTGNAIAIFFNSLGGAIAISVAQNIFVNGLVKYIPQYAPNVNPLDVFNAGATHIPEVVSVADLPGVLQAYMRSLNQAFILPVAVGGIAVGLACFVEWKSVKGKKVVASAA